MLIYYWSPVFGIRLGSVMWDSTFARIFAGKKTLGASTKIK
jgi:hypothetical protein